MMTSNGIPALAHMAQLRMTTMAGQSPSVGTLPRISQHFVAYNAPAFAGAHTGMPCDRSNAVRVALYPPSLRGLATAKRLVGR